MPLLLRQLLGRVIPRVEDKEAGTRCYECCGYLGVSPRGGAMQGRTAVLQRCARDAGATEKEPLHGAEVAPKTCEL